MKEDLAPQLLQYVRDLEEFPNPLPNQNFMLTLVYPTNSPVYILCVNGI
jgi:hypothetical protein